MSTKNWTDLLLPAAPVKGSFGISTIPSKLFSPACSSRLADLNSGRSAGMPVHVYNLKSITVPAGPPTIRHPYWLQSILLNERPPKSIKIGFPKIAVLAMGAGKTISFKFNNGIKMASPSFKGPLKASKPPFGFWGSAENPSISTPAAKLKKPAPYPCRLLLSQLMRSSRKSL